MEKKIAAGLLMSLVAVSTAHAATISVSGPADFASALRRAADGDTLVLAGGNYGTLSISNRNFARGLVITSANPASPARFGKTAITLSSGITFRSVGFQYDRPAGTPEYDPGVLLRLSQRISFQTTVFQGKPDGDASKEGWGVFVDRSTGVTIRDSLIREQAVGVMAREADGLQLIGNRFETLRRDGVNLAETTGATISGNRFSNFSPINGEHPDAIQMWTAGTKESSRNIRISNNLVVGSPSGQMQGIFLGSEAGFALPYENVSITDNLIAGAMWNGIYIRLANGLTVSGNNVYTLPDLPITQSWIRLIDVRSGILAKNSAANFLYQNVSSGLTRVGNVSQPIRLSNLLEAIRAWDRTYTADTAGLSLALALGGNSLPGGTAPPPVPPASGPSVPEPSSWVTLIVGFGIMGTMVRRRRSRKLPAIGRPAAHAI